MTTRTPLATPSLLPVVVRTVADLRLAVRTARNLGKSVGLVPTMGALHLGHAALIEAARRQTDFVVVSIFVNPTQFGHNEDLGRYPRTLEADLELCTKAGADLIFAPEVIEVYPTGTLTTFVEVPELANLLEGISRPGHFRGVATVVLKLFNMVGPDVAFFGAKDYQQQLLIRQMVQDLDVPVRIETQPTVREGDGLALSSRNRYLSPADRAVAPRLYQALQAARTEVERGEVDLIRVRQMLWDTLKSESLLQPETVDLVDAQTLHGVDRIERGRQVVALLAVRLGATRLIDNILLTE